MALFATLITTVRTTDAKRAAAIVAEARKSGAGSNKTNWARTERLLAAVLTVIATGTPVDITEALGEAGAKPYHTAHRALSGAPLRPYWHKVQVVALRNAEFAGREVTGETDTVRGRTVLLTPVG